MYTPLKITTDYSLLKSLIKVKDLINFCTSNNIKNCAICDTNLFGAIEFYKNAKDNNIKPIIGLEISINNLPIYLYAENYAGYKNMLKINTIICEEEITIENLQKYSDNVLTIIPYKSRELYPKLSFFKHLYLGYENAEELKNELITTNNVVYVNDVKSLTKENLKYLKYLDIIGEKEPKDYSNNYINTENLTKFDLEKWMK